MGGAGKSTLATKIYRENETRSFWADASRETIFPELARRVLEKFGCAVPQEESQRLGALIRCLCSGDYLLILDNLESLLEEDGRFKSSFYEQFFLEWLESGDRSKILVTTRERWVTLDEKTGKQQGFRGIRWLSLEGFAVEEGIAFLESLGVCGQLEEFVRLVKGQPLLLRIVADLLLDEFPENPSLERLPELGLGNLRELLIQVEGVHRRQNVALARVLDVSFERLSERQKSLLLSVGVFRGGFDERAALGVWGEEDQAGQIGQELRQLRRRSWLQVEDKKGKREYVFQPVVLEYVRYKAGDLSEVHQRAIAYYAANLKAKPWQNLDDVQEYLEIFHHRYQLGEYDLAFDTIRKCDEFLTLRGYYTVRVEVYEQLVAAYENRNEKANWKYGASLTDLGNAYQSLGQYQQAIHCLQQSLEFDRKHSNRKEEGRSLNNLGIIYDCLGKYQESINYYEQSLMITQEIGDRQGQANTVGNLGTVYNSLGRYEQAIYCHRQQLNFAKESGDSPEERLRQRQGEATSLVNLGIANYSLERYEPAIHFYQQGLDIAREIGDRRREAASLGNLGLVHHALGKYGKAIDFHEQSLKIDWEIGDRRGEANSLGNLGMVYDSLGRCKKAIEFYERQLDIVKEIDDLRGQANCYLNLGLTLARMERNVDAMGAFRNARELYQAMGLDAYVQKCDEECSFLSSTP